MSIEIENFLYNLKMLYRRYIQRRYIDFTGVQF